MKNFVMTEFLLGCSLAVEYIKLSAESQDDLMHLIVSDLQILGNNLKICLVKTVILVVNCYCSITVLVRVT